MHARKESTGQIRMYGKRECLEQISVHARRENAGQIKEVAEQT